VPWFNRSTTMLAACTLADPSLLKAEPLPAATARLGLRRPLRIAWLEAGVVNTVLMAHLDQKTPGRC
jgi:hypothetical protein